MRIRLIIVAVLVVILAACRGGGDTTATQPIASAPIGQASSTPAPPGKGNVDCAAIKTAAQELLSVQLLAQLKTPDAIASIKAKQIGNLDLDTFLAAMHTMHSLDSYSSVLGDPKAAIDFYEEAGAAAKVLFATDPMTQAAIDTYNQNVGTVVDFIGHQSAISGAMSTAGC